MHSLGTVVFSFFVTDCGIVAILTHKNPKYYKSTKVETFVLTYFNKRKGKVSFELFVTS